ncbi:hypothetical protein EVAR_79872_1 [Eumeta japonica]|uniref:Uncharacterized protein n=1 Tax=Eumeta variegata TaxID=151549 RepID=A0A4C1TYX9_EUMVA|nr:hypothetical protein EVAR_79872_1 [Eumeta japonica]
MENKRFKEFLTKCGHFDLPREFEVYCASPAFPDAIDNVFDPDMEVEFNLGKKPSKRPAAVRSSEDSTYDFDPGWSDATDGSTYFRVTPAYKKPKKAINAKTNIPVKSTQSIYDASESWRKSSQPTAGLQGAVDTGEFKVAAPAAAKNNNISD